MALPLVLGSLLVVVGVVGLADAAYFTGVAYRWIRPDAPWVPRVCRMDRDTCASIVDTRYGRALGVPNSAVGLLWYLVVLGSAGWLLANGSLPACAPLLVAAAGVVLFSVFLIWALVEQLKVACPLCYLAHGLNFAILALFALACAV